MNDVVSIIIPTFNCGKTLDRCIHSVLIQSYPNIEIIIINDCSTDNTVEVLKNYREYDNIIILHNNKNYGKFVSVNIGIQHSNSKYITILDADDIFHEDKIQQQIIVFNLFDNCIAVFHNILINNLDGSKKIRNDGEISVMFKKKEILESIGYFDSNRYGCDSEFKDRIYKYFDKSRIITINKILYIAFKRYNSLTTSPATGIHSTMRQIYEANYRNWHKNTKKLYVDFPLHKKLF